MTMQSYKGDLLWQKD